SVLSYGPRPVMVDRPVSFTESCEAAPHSSVLPFRPSRRHDRHDRHVVMNITALKHRPSAIIAIFIVCSPLKEKKSMALSRAVIWIDHHNAQVLQFDADHV